MSDVPSPSGVPILPYTYDDFQGIDSSRDKGSLDTGQKQHMYTMENAYANYRGIIMRNPACTQRTDGDKLIYHVTHFSRDGVVWAQKDGGGVTLKSERDHELQEAYTSKSIVSSTNFNNKVIFFSRDQNMCTYDGLKFETISDLKSDSRPAFGVAIQRRLAISGQSGRSTIVDISRVDTYDRFTDDEDTSDASVLKASDIDISNIIGTADEIKGLGVFEKNRLAVFTNDQTIIYQITPDYTQWVIDDKAAIREGTVSHNTIANVGTDIIFCSRHGVHSLRRSDLNGVTIYAVPLSSQITELYTDLIKSVKNPETISAYYDSDTGQYTVFFPQNEQTSVGLTMTVSPNSEEEPKWSTTTFLNARCGNSLGGDVVLGTPGGVWTRHNLGDEGQLTPDISITTPILWQGSIVDAKESKEFIIQASGTGSITVTAYNEAGRLLQSMVIPLDHEAGDDSFPDIPLSRQYNRRFEHQYKGVQFKFEASGTGRLKIIGFAVMVRDNRTPSQIAASKARGS